MLQNASTWVRVGFPVLAFVLAALVVVAQWFVTKSAAMWNVAGLLLLGTVVIIAILATPLFEAFGPNAVNTWISHYPYVWLPTVMVPFALFGQLLVFRKLFFDRRIPGDDPLVA